MDKWEILNPHYYFQSSQHPILWVGLSISSTYHPKLIVHFKGKVGLNKIIKHNTYTVSTSLQHPWLNGPFRKKPNRGGWRYTFSKTPVEFLAFLLCLWTFQTKQIFTPRNSTKFCCTLHKFYSLKPRPLKIPHHIFLITPRNSMFFLINPWKIHLLFLQ